MDLNNEVVSDIAKLVHSASKPETDIPFAIIPEGFDVRSLEAMMEDKEQIKQGVSVTSASSFIAYLSRYKDERTVIFADVKRTCFSGRLDYHLNSITPEKNTHRVVYDCPLSDEWQAFIKHDKSKFDQIEFAEFIENYINCVAPVSDDYKGPAGAELLAMVLAFQETRESAFKSVQRLSDGTCQFSFSNEKSGSGNTQLPEKISLALAPFHNGEKYQIDARIRYRLREGRLSLWFELIEPDKIIEHAFNEIMVELETQLPEVPVFEGTI